MKRREVIETFRNQLNDLEQKHADTLDEPIRPDQPIGPDGSKGEQPKTRTVKVLAYSPDFIQSLVGYLQTKPWAEVNVLIQSLSQAAPFDVTITDGK
jgi:hypothetical protein